MPAAENTARVRPLHDEPQPANGNAEVVALENPKAEGPAPTTTAAQPASKPKGDARRRIVVSVIALAALAGAGWWGYNYMAFGRFMVSTDDAYVGGDIAAISPKLSGYVAKVEVVANQQVKAGDPVVTLDDGDYVIARDQAQATIDTQNLVAISSWEASSGM